MAQVNIGGGAVVGEETENLSVLTPGATVTVDCSKGNIFTLTPAQNATLNATNVQNDEQYQLVVSTSGTTSYTLTFGTNFHASGTLATGTVDAKTFVVNFVSIAGTLVETGRTAAF